MAPTLTYTHVKPFEGDAVAVSVGNKSQWQRYVNVSPDGKDTYAGSVATNTAGTNTR